MGREFHPGDTNLLLGHYTNTLETENRLLLPQEFREDYRDGLYLTQGFDRNIMMLTIKAFDEMYASMTSLNLADPLARLLLRMILGFAHRTEIESNGTIRIPEKLKEFARLDRDVIVLGQGNFSEIWSSEVWSDQETELRDAISNPNRFASLNLSTH
jgi:MraZ protein